MCKHTECPYRYCLFHKYYDPEQEPICDFLVPDDEEAVNDCVSYLDS